MLEPPLQSKNFIFFKRPLARTKNGVTLQDLCPNGRQNLDPSPSGSIASTSFNRNLLKTLQQQQQQQQLLQRDQTDVNFDDVDAAGDELLKPTLVRSEVGETTPFL